MNSQAEWEIHATLIANAKTEDVRDETYAKLTEMRGVDPKVPARVIFARDTRASGPALVTALKDALEATDTEFTDFGELTTPQLHYLVRCTNTAGTPQAYGKISEEGYYEKLSKAFVEALDGRNVNGAVTVDCANGVGGPKLKELIKFLPTASQGGIDIKVVNDDTGKFEALNHQVLSFCLIHSNTH